MSVVSQTVDQQKLDRLTAAAQGGQQGLNEFDASQKSVAGERASMAAGLASDAKSAGYVGPALGGAPSVLSGQLNAGLNPYQTALTNDRAEFGQNLRAGLQANTTYLDAVKAAEAPSLAARGGSGGGGGGRSGSSGKPLTDTELTKVLLQAAAQQQAAHVGQINQSEQAAASGEKVAATNLANNPTGPALPAGARLDLPSTVQTAGNGPQLGNGPSEANPQLAQALAARAASISSSRFQSKKAEQAAASILQTRVARQQRVEGESILPIAQSLAQQASAQSGDPTIAQRASYLLTPSVEETYRNALKSSLPKVSTSTPSAGPTPFPDAARSAGISAGDIPKALGENYHYKDSKGQIVQGTGIVNDLIAAAKRAASSGYDKTSFLELLQQNAPYLTAALNNRPNIARFADAVIDGFWPQAPQVATNPYVAYYNQQFPPVPVG